LSPLSFQATHNSILATTLDETGLWLLQHDKYISWKTKSREALLWVHGKHGSGKSHLAAQVVEELRRVCQERNAETGNSNDHERGDGDPALRIANTEDDLVTRSAEDESTLALWQGPGQEDTYPANSSDDNVWSSLVGATSHRTATSEAQSTSDKAALAYIYCSSQQVQSSNRLGTGRGTQAADWYDTTGLLSCILKQLYQFLPRDLDIPELTQACFETREDQPSREAIMNGIKSIIPMFSQAFIVVDGLDECSGVSGLEFETFCNFLTSLTSVSKKALGGSSARVLIFSRLGYQAITNATNGCPSIEVDKGANTEDISRFIGDRSENLTRDFASLREIQGHLLDSADGMFLWVSLVIDSVKQERTAKKMKAAARNMPKGLHGAYTDALKRIIAAEPSVKELALKALLWTTNSKKPLSKAQLLEVLAIEEGMTSIGGDERLDDDIPLTKDCADLLVLKDGQYMLLHPSLGDFLRGLCDDNVEGLEDYQDLQTNAPRILGGDCLTYLNFDTFTRGPMPTETALKAMFESHPFLEYAAVFWGDHLREALDRDNSGLMDSTCELLELQQRRDLIHQVYMRFSSRRGEQVSIFPFPSRTMPLHILSIFGLHHLLLRYRITKLDINQADGFGNCPLDYASQNGHEAMSTKIVEEHISRVHDINGELHRQCKSKSWLMGTIIRQHWTDLMITLLELGHSTDRQGTRRTPTALHLASYSGYTDMMEKLLLSGADVDARDHKGYTPLMIAAQSNHFGATEMLLEHGANVSYHGLRGETALHIVAGLPNGKKEVAAALLDNGGNLEAKAESGETPLHCASGFASETMVSVLLDRGANMEAVTHTAGHTPLLIASIRGRSDAVRLLLSRGASVQAVTRTSSTALLEAAAKDNLTTLSQILAAPHGKIMLDWRDSDGCTALFAAAHMGSFASAKRLLEEGADVDSADNAGITPLLVALGKGHTSLARMLVEVYNANPNHANHKGWTAMHFSACRGSVEAIEMLLSRGVEAFAQNEGGWTPLHYAVVRNNAQVVEYYVKSFPAEASPHSSGTFVDGYP
jgi:ankyrin repeat protein